MSNAHVSGDATGNDFVSRETVVGIDREELEVISRTLKTDYVLGSLMCRWLACECDNRETPCPLSDASFECPFQKRGCTVTDERWEIFIRGYEEGMNHAYAVSDTDVSRETKQKENEK